MDFFRAILRQDERTPRALELTKEVIDLNPANYTAWYFRRLVMDALKDSYDLHDEIKFVSKVGSKHPKNYQIWYHRKVIVEKLGDFSQELQYTQQQIEEDSKNYHAWAHRQWVVETTGSWEAEITYIESLLKDDSRNNSAWNQRFFVVTKNRTQTLTPQLREQEIEFAFTYTRKSPNNQSPWSYLRGLFTYSQSQDNSALKDLCLNFRQKYVTCPHVVVILIDVLEQEKTSDSYKQAIEYCDELANSLDTIHSKYWKHKKETLLAASGL